MRERSRARSRALQVMYAWESQAESATPEQVLGRFVEEGRIGSEALEYTRRLIRLLTANRPAVDRALSDSLTNWRLERLSVIDRNVLRIGAVEMMHVPDVPPRVSIQEAIGLAERFGTGESPRFVNGVLDALMRKLSDAGADAGTGTGKAAGPGGAVENGGAAH
jgi:transcription antitermination protein NusB